MDNNDSDKFIDLFGYLLNSLEPIKKEKSVGDLSKINFFEINEETNNLIKKKIKKKINNIVVKKEYIRYKKRIVDKLGGKKGQMEREINSLLKLYKKQHFPILLSKNEKDYYIYMSYCGVPLNNNNVPHNWKEQLLEIIKTLKLCNVSNNDMWKNNFLVLNNILYLVDFGWARNEDNFPFINISESDVNKFENIFKLFDYVFERVLKKRTKFICNYD